MRPFQAVDLSDYVVWAYRASTPPSMRGALMTNLKLLFSSIKKFKNIQKWHRTQVYTQVMFGSIILHRYLLFII